MQIITGTIRTTEVQWLPVLANIAPPDLRRLIDAERIVDKIKRNPKLPLYEDIISHPHKRLKSRHPIWDLILPVEALSITWKTRWKNSGERGVTLIENPETRIPGFDLPRKLWSTLNRIRTEQGRSKSLLHTWGMEQSPFCPCGIEQTIKHIVEECPITKFEGGIPKLHDTKIEAINWLINLEIPL